MMSTEDSSHTEEFKETDEEIQINKVDNGHTKTSTKHVIHDTHSSIANNSHPITSNDMKSGSWTDNELFGGSDEKESPSRSDEDLGEENEEKEETTLSISGIYAAEPAALYRAVNGKWEEMGKGYLRCIILKVIAVVSLGLPLEWA